MSLEVEVKAYAYDLEEIEKRLVSKGAISFDDVEQEDIYFNSPFHDFKVTDEALRMREEQREGEEKSSFLTYKGPKIDGKSKTRVEITVAVDAIVPLKELLESLGFEEFGRVKKRRRRYEFDDLEVCLDDVEGLGRFVEVESLKKISLKGNELASERDRIKEQLNDLGLDKFERASYLELLYLSKKGKIKR